MDDKNMTLYNTRIYDFRTRHSTALKYYYHFGSVRVQCDVSRLPCDYIIIPFVSAPSCLGCLKYRKASCTRIANVGVCITKDKKHSNIITAGYAHTLYFNKSFNIYFIPKTFQFNRLRCMHAYTP